VIRLPYAAILGAFTGAIAALILVHPLLATEPVVTAAEVQAIQARIPNCERCETTGGFAKVGDAKAVAAAISQVATTREDACDLALFAAWEGGNQLHIVGDQGRAFGVWQLHGFPPRVAFDPVQAARAWLQVAAASRTMCRALPPEEQLAALVSGSCDRGREQSRHRDQVSHMICSTSQEGGP
jgi:hypothetical protein